jgi:hypothetical protein
MTAGAFRQAAARGNPQLPLRSLTLVGTPLPRCSHAAAAALAPLLRGMRSPLHSLTLDGCGVTRASLRIVLHALLQHEERPLAIRALRSLSLNTAGLEDASVAAALCELLRRARGLRELRLLPGSGGASDVGSDEASAIAPHSAAAGGGGGWWWAAAPPPLAPILQAAQHGCLRLERLALCGCAIAPSGGDVTLELLGCAASLSQLQHLSLAGTGIAADALCAVCSVLLRDARDARRTPLLAFDVSRNRLGPQGGLKLAACLSQAHALSGARAATIDVAARRG